MPFTVKYSKTLATEPASFLCGFYSLSAARMYPISIRTCQRQRLPAAAHVLPAASPIPSWTCWLAALQAHLQPRNHCRCPLCHLLHPNGLSSTTQSTMLGELLLQQEAFTGIPTMPRHSHSWSSLLIVVLFFHPHGGTQGSGSVMGMRCSCVIQQAGSRLVRAQRTSSNSCRGQETSAGCEYAQPITCRKSCISAILLDGSKRFVDTGTKWQSRSA